MTLADLRLGLRAFLLADSNIANAVGGANGRVHPVILPQGQTANSIVYTRISGQSGHWMNGPDGPSGPRYQIDCWSQAAGEANSLSNLVKERLDGYRGPMPYGSNSPQDYVNVLGAFFVDEREDYDAASKLYRVSRDFFIWFREF